jgi:monofunctional biosynthetic peptidoglycan transglycosylase
MKRIIEILLIYIPAVFLVISFSGVILYKWIPVRWTTLMLVRYIENCDQEVYVNTQSWVDIEDVSPNLIEAIIISEDQSFYTHNGFDFAELQRMKKDYDHYGKNLRGCSTISQQVAKNCFTFCSHTVMRKAIEAYYTMLIEFFWSKERILEVYLNIAETGRGLFGVESACNRYFSCSSSEISISDAAALACVLPKPLTRTPTLVLTNHANKHSKIAQQIGQNLSHNRL